MSLHLLHTIRRADGTWYPFGDVEGQTGVRGPFAYVGCAEVAGELHVVGTDTQGQLWHTIRHANGGWDPLGDVQQQAGFHGPFNDISCSGLNGDLHLIGINSQGQLWHTIRYANRYWHVFGDVQAQCGAHGPYRRISAAIVNGELHVIVANMDNQLWHTIRYANGNWQPFVNVAPVSTNTGPFFNVNCAGVNGELYVLTVIPGVSQLSWAIRHANGTWDHFTDVGNLAGDRGFLGSIAGAAVGTNYDVLASCGAPPDQGQLWLAIRQSNNSWSQFADVRAATGSNSLFTEVCCAGINNELHVVGIAAT